MTGASSRRSLGGCRSTSLRRHRSPEPPFGPKGRGVGTLLAGLNDRAIATWYQHLDACLAMRAKPAGLVEIYADYLRVVQTGGA